MAPPLLLLGSGYTLTRLAVDEARAGRDVLAATRDPGRREALTLAGARVVELEEALARTGGADVVVSLPPEAGLDSRVAEALASRPAARLVYLSSTGVYGKARGAVDEDTPVDVATPGSLARVEAESRYLPHGAMVLRIAGIYGPGRSMHTRLLAGTLRLPDRGGRISRVHVDDLVEAIRVVLADGEPGALYCVADDRAAPQVESVSFLAGCLGVPLPPTVPLESLPETLRGDRAVSNARLKALGWTPRYPDFTAGFPAVLAAEGHAVAPAQLVIRRILPDEVEAFRALRLASLTAHPESFGASAAEDAALPLEVLRSKLDGGATALVLGAYEGTRLVGMGGVRREPGAKVAHKAGIWGIYVAPEARSRGLGRRLLMGLVSEARRMPGVEQVQLAVVSGNASASSLYRSLGFQTYGVEPRAIKIGDAYVDKELMVLSL
ncbi:GNAT family N-acetyltransferase [Myxococcus sp. K15C18031901]|uniref:GNAT family N-acetyltransferase n=1 Tax=Myxococcus dinghuensis TaxID=2906761 RepID=UPI0020A6EF58|nr:GNAT family N-acetyltransferase [Myxococcus dinghuensis]MCP3103354.1 GNAT family N-acetyltransferase [Myxococcus dinghuensis]